MPGRMMSIVVLGKKEKKSAPCPVDRRKQPNYNRKKV